MSLAQAFRDVSGRLAGTLGEGGHVATMNMLLQTVILWFCPLNSYDERISTLAYACFICRSPSSHVCNHKCQLFWQSVNGSLGLSFL